MVTARIVETSFVKNCCDVLFHCSFTNDQRGGNRRIRARFRHVRHNFTLPGRERAERVVSAPV